MSLELPQDDPWVSRGYGQGAIEPGERPAVLVVDLQYAFTDPQFPLGGAPLVERAVEGTARVVRAARTVGVPVYQTVVAWRDDGSDIGLWPVKLPILREVTLDSRWSQVDERVWDDSDVLLVKKWPSFFHGTPLFSLLTAAQRDTVLVTGCMTSGCVRATTVDAFSYGFRTLVPEDCVGDQGREGHESNLRDVHRRYAEVTSADEVIAYLERVRAEVPYEPGGEGGGRVSGRVEGARGNREVPPEKGGVAARREGGPWGKQGFPHATEPEAREVAV